MRLNVVIILLLSMMATACNNESVKVSYGNVSLIGKTYSLCTNEAMGSTYEAYHFVDSTTFTWTVVTHSGNDCQVADRIDTRFSTAQYIYDVGTKILKEKFLKEVLTAHDPGLVASLNAIGDTCGNDGNWAIDVPVDITGLSGCDGGDFTPDTTYYDRPNVTLNENVFIIGGISLYP